MIKLTFCTLVTLLILHIAKSELNVTIIGVNDIHGKAFPTVLVNSKTNQTYNYGGLVYMASIIEIIEQENKGNTLLFDAGDQFQGGIESSSLISKGNIMNDFYNTMGVKAASIGNHEFDFGPSFLLPYLSSKESTNIAANLRSENGEINFLPHQKSSALFETANGIKIGVIGLSTKETPSTTAGFGEGGFPAYRFLEYKEIVESESSKLKRAGANAVIIVSHIGDACKNDFTYGIRNIETLEDECPDDEISELLKELPKGTVDGVVQGHRHRTAHNYKYGIPYIGSINGGYYLNTIKLIFNDDKTIKYTEIEGPIPVCEKIFEKRARCDYIPPDEIDEAGELIDFKFHNNKIVAHTKLQEKFNAYSEAMKPFLIDIVNNELYLVKVENQESELGNLFTNLVSEAIPGKIFSNIDSDFVIMNPGGFRTEWVPGIIQYQHFYNMFPFKNELVTFEITGKELLETLKIIQSGEKGFYQSWNLEMHVTYDEETKKKGFVSARFMNGTEIESSKTYKGTSIDFLINGGDDFSKVINKVFVPKNVKKIGEFKQIIQPFLENLKSIKPPLIDPQHPRLILS